MKKQENVSIRKAFCTANLTYGFILQKVKLFFSIARRLQKRIRTYSILVFIQMTRGNTHDPVTDMTNNYLRAVYAYLFTGNLNELKIEKDLGLGFEAWPVEKLHNLTGAEKQRFIPSCLDETVLGIFNKIKEHFSK